ncbi:MAG TPA: choice-of-anchor X domain-containing protein [Telluria sp.]|nr:choice-of-anchor X domain-containing protein [Telluria sp.]
MLLLATLAGCGGGNGATAGGPVPVPAGAGGNVRPDVMWDRWTPYVIPHERTEPVLYEVGIVGNTTGAVTLALSNSGGNVALNDDGAGGDRIARDGVWSARIDAATVLARNAPTRVHRPVIGFLKVPGAEADFNVFAEVFSATLPVVAVRPLDQGGQETDYVANYVGTADQLLQPDRNHWARRFYATHGDDYDFLHVVMVSGRRSNRSHVRVRNAVEGIGQGLFDQSAAAGSKGRLLGVSLYPMSTGFDPAEKAFAHETAHQWIQYLPGVPFAQASPHWPAGSVAANVMGFSMAGGVGGDHPFLYEPSGTGYVLKPAAPLQGATFNLMELYLMGLASASEVPDFVLLKDQSRQVGVGTQLSASDVQPMRIADVIAAAGPRKPDASAAQRHFRIATIVVSERALDARELSFFDFFARRAEATTTLHCAVLLGDGPCLPWHLATGARSTMTSKLR